MSVDESPKLLNPDSGWLYNSNNSPWSAAGPSSPRQSDYPKYVDNGVESARGLHAILVLENKKDFTVDSLRDAAYDSFLTWFEKPIPALMKAWDQMPASNALKTRTADQIALLRKWDLRWSTQSVPTSLAVYWAEDLDRQRIAADARRAGMTVPDYIAAAAKPEQTNSRPTSASGRHHGARSTGFSD